MAKDSIVQIYSMTKIVTSAAILMLMEEGKLKLQDPVDKFLPALRQRQVLVGGTAEAPVLAPAVRPITVHDLLTHTAGYYYDAEWSVDSPVAIELFQRARIWEATSADDFVQRVAAIPLREQPGTKFRYGISIDLLGAIVEKASGQSLATFFAERIFQPLGMVDSGFSVPAAKATRMAKTYSRGTDGRLQPQPPLSGTESREGAVFFSGGGGLRSTAADYARFAQMLLNGGQLDGRRLLSRKSVELMRSNHIAHLADPHPFASPHLGFGLGVRMVTDLGRSPLLGSPGMFGWDGAATTMVWMDPKERIVAIILTQHLPYNEDDIFATFVNGYNAALDD
jgi:CubicO group peptidase (beta-lactamase class C family)